MSCYLFIDIIIKKKLAKLENISAQGPLKKKHATQNRRIYSWAFNTLLVGWNVDLW